MTTKRYALNKGEPKRLSLSWGRNFSNFTVRLDGIVIGSAPDKYALYAGFSIRLDDGSELYIYCEKNVVKVSRSGKPLPGSPGDPQVVVNSVTGILIFVAIATFASGGLGSNIYTQQQSSIYVVVALVFALVYGALAYFVHSRSKTALWIAIGLYGLDTFGTLLIMFQPSKGFAIVPLVVHILLLFGMWRGLDAIDELIAQEYRSPLVSSLLQPLPARFPNLAQDNGSGTVSVPIADAPAPLPVANSEQLLRQAVDIIKNGGAKQEAKSLVNAAIRIDSRNANAWYLIGYLAETTAERRNALERTLSLDPNHFRAKQELNKLLA